MKRSLTLWLTSGLIAVLLMSMIAQGASPWMSTVKTNDKWKPHRIYRNYIGICITPFSNGDNWDIGLFKTKKGKKPVAWHQYDNWINGNGYNFTLVFHKDTGQVDFTIDNAPMVSYVFDEYAELGMDQIHLSANTHNDASCWSYTYITNLKVNGEPGIDFVNLDGFGKFYTYATIGGLGCEDFTLTGRIFNNWIGHLLNQKIQMNIRFGEACGVSEQTRLYADLNNDGFVDFEDYAILASYWLDNTCQDPEWCDDADFDKGGIIDSNDVEYFVSEWLEKNYGGGVGSPEAPYLIYTAEQLHTAGMRPQDWGAHFKLRADIDLSEYTGNSFNTLGNETTSFTGVFNGNGHAITNFTQGDANNPVVGLFRYVDGGDAVIKNIRLINANVCTEKPYYAGILVGQLKNGLIQNCSVQDGEIAGYTGEALDIGADYIGGLVGYNINGTVSECSAGCDIIGYNYVGGLVGKNESTIERCFSDGNNVVGHDKVGGLIGLNAGGNISDSYSMKPIFAHDQVGGLVGEDSNGLVEKCYSIGYVSENSDDRGGFAGLVSGIVNNSFWNIETGGSLNDNGVATPLTTIDMMSLATYTSVGWDFNTPIWIITDGTDYPLLLWYAIPRPSPMTWDVEPDPNGSHSVTMTATTGSSYDGSDVMYYFANVTDSNHDSGWQNSPNYVDTGLEESTEYTYKVKLRNTSNYENEWSQEIAVTTLYDSIKPQPNPTQWLVPPYASGPNSITMTGLAWDAGGVEYYFVNITDPNHDSNWQENPTYEDSGLDDLTEYTYRIVVRDKSMAQNLATWSSPEFATTQDDTPPEADPNWWISPPTETGPFSITMTAAANDVSGVEYYFHNVTDPNHDSGWQDETIYEDIGLNELTEYTYQVKARDKSVNNNETVYSTGASAETSADLVPPEPNQLAWASEPNETGPTTIIMTAVTAMDPMGVEYYFHNVTDSNHDSGWQNNQTYEDSGLGPNTTCTYKVKARDKSANQNETAYSSSASATTSNEFPELQEQWIFYSIPLQDGRVWNNGANTVGIDSENQDDDDVALRIGDYSGQQSYRSIVSFDTSVLPDDCSIISVTLELTKGDLYGIDPFTWGGSCVIDIANPYFGTGADLNSTDWEAVATADSIATFSSLPGPNELSMISTPFNTEGLDNININGLTQLKVYFTNLTNGNSEFDFIGFYSGDYSNCEYRPKLIVTYNTRTPTETFYSIPEDDGRVWDVNNGVGDGNDWNDDGDIALRLGDYSGLQGYKVVVSFDTNDLPDNCTILSAWLELTRGAYAGNSPFNWGENCLIDIASPYLGTGEVLEAYDWQAPADAAAIAAFLADPGTDYKMVSTGFNSEGFNNINLEGKTQLRVYFTVPNTGDFEADFLGFYSGEQPDDFRKPKLIIRYERN